MEYRHAITDEQWARIEDMCPGRKGSKSRPAKDNRKFVNAIIWICRTGAPWRDVPHEFGKWNSIARRFSRWSKKNVWQNIFEELSKDADMEWLMLDSTIVRAHQHAAGAKGGLKQD